MTPNQSKKIKEEKKKTAVTAVVTPKQNKSEKKKKAEKQESEDTPLKTPKNNGSVKSPDSPTCNKMTTESDFAVYVTRKLLKGLGSEPSTPSDSVTKKESKVSHKKNTATKNEVQKEPTPNAKQKSEDKSSPLPPSEKKTKEVKKKETKSTKVAVAAVAAVAAASVQHKDTNGHKDNVDPVHHDIVPDQSDFASYVTRRLLKNLSDTPIPEEPKITPKPQKNQSRNTQSATKKSKVESKQDVSDSYSHDSDTLGLDKPNIPPKAQNNKNRKTASATKKPKVEPKHDVSDSESNDSDTPATEEPKITPKAQKNHKRKTPSITKKPNVEPKHVVTDSDSDDSDDGTKFDLKKMKFPISARRPEPPPSIKHVSSDHFSSDSDTDKYALKKMTTAVAKKGRNFSSIDIIHSDENATGTERSPEEPNKKSSTKKSKVFQVPESLDSDGSLNPKVSAPKVTAVPIRTDLNSSCDSDTDKYELKQMTSKAVKKSKTKQPATDIPEPVEPKKTTKATVLAKLLKAKASTNKTSRRKSEPINRFLDTHSSDEDILEAAPVPEKKIPNAKPKAKRPSKKKYSKYNSFPTIDERFDTLFGPDLSSGSNNVVSYNTAPNDSRGKYSSDSSDSDLDLDDEDDIPISIPKKSRKKTPKSAPPKSKPKKERVVREKKFTQKERSFLETSEEEEEEEKETKIPQSSKSVAHEIPPMQNDYANYVTRTLLKAITTVEQPKASSSSKKTPAKKTPKQKDSASAKKKGGALKKAESEKVENKKDYSSSEDEPLRPSNNKDLSEESDMEDSHKSTKKSGKKAITHPTHKTWPSINYVTTIWMLIDPFLHSEMPLCCAPTRKP